MPLVLENTVEGPAAITRLISLTPATHSFRGEGLNYETGYGINGGKTARPGVCICGIVTVK